MPFVPDKKTTFEKQTPGFVLDDPSGFEGQGDFTIAVDPLTSATTIPVKTSGEEEFSLSSPQQKVDWVIDGPIGWWEYGKRTLFSDIYLGPIMGVGSLKGLTDRVTANEYDTEEKRQKDLSTLKDVMMYKEEVGTRGLSWGTQVYKIVSQIPTFMAEMWATGPLASATRKKVTATGVKLGVSAAKKGLIRKGVEVLGREAVVGAVRTSVLPHRYVAGYAERRLDDSLSITDKGIQILEDSKEEPMLTFIKAYGDSFVEYYTETLGGELLKPIGRVAGKGVLSKMPKGARASFVKTAELIKSSVPEGKVTRFFSRAGFDGIAEEFGEERLGALLRIPLGLDEREKPTLDKLQEAVFPGWQQSLIEIGAFSIWGGASASGQMLANHLKGKGKGPQEIKEMLGNLSQQEKDKMAVQFSEAFDEDVKISQLIIKAAGGAELTTNEKQTLETVHQDFIDKGFIEPPEEIPELEAEEIKKLKTPEAKADAIVKASQAETEDIDKKIKLLYQGRETQLDQRLTAIEKEMTLLEQQRVTQQKEGRPIKVITDKIEKLSNELESIHFQIADLEDTAVSRLEKEGITIKGEELERLRKKAFRRGEVKIRKELLASIKAKQQEKKKRAKAAKIILKQPKKPEGVVDVKYQNKINTILDKLATGGKLVSRKGEKISKGQIRKRNLAKMSTPELEKLADEVATLKDTGRKLFTSKKAQRKMASEILRAVLIKNAGGMPDGTFAKGSVEEKKAKRANIIKQGDINATRPLMMIRALLGKQGEKLVYDTIDYADMIKNISGLSRKAAVKESMEKHKVSLFDLGTKISIDGNTYQVNDILRMYLAQKDQKSYEALLFGNKLTPEEVTAFIDRVKKDYPSYIKFADDVQKVVANRYEQIAETMAEYFNVNVEKVKVYFPLRRVALGVSQEELNQDIESELVFEQALRKGEGFSYTSTSKGFTISRQNINEQFQTEISLDFLGDAYRTIDKQEQLIAFAPLHKAFNKIINDQALQEAIKYNHSSAAWKWLNDYLVKNINPDVMYQGGGPVTRWANRLLRGTRRGLTKAYLGFNAVTSLKQLPSLELAVKYTTHAELATSLGRIVASKEAREEVYKLDPSLRNRVISRDFEDVVKVISSLPESDLKRRLLIVSQKIDKAAFTAIMQMDKYAVLAVYDAVYRTQSKTLSIAESKDIAHKAVIETQPQGGIKDLPAIYTTNNEFLRMTLMFTNQLNQIWNMMRHTLPAELSQKQYARAAKGVGSIMVSSTLIYIMSHGRLPEDWDDLIDAIFGSTISSVPIVGNIGMSYFRGYDPSISPLSAVGKSMKRVAGNIKNEDYFDGFVNSLFLLAVWLEMPYSQFKRTTQGIYDIATGETVDPRRLIWSEHQLEND